jgi:hypothetical protein
MKFGFIHIFYCALAVCLIESCSFNGPSTTDEPQGKDYVVSDTMPLNLSIYLDLSSRLDRKSGAGISQSTKDSLIVNTLIKKFVRIAVKEKIQPCKNQMRIFFYPSPNNPNIVALSQKLNIDMTAFNNPAEKKQAVVNMNNGMWDKALGDIYRQSMINKHWIGADIYGFFKYKAQNQCVKKGYKNILVILTDGYIYYKDNAQSEGHIYTYITPKTLNDPTSKMKVPDVSGLNDLHVLMLETNPTDLKKFDRMHDVISDWLKGMHINDFYIGQTDDNISNTQKDIDNFLDRQ